MARGLLAALGFLAAAAIVFARIALGHYGLSDFRDAIYYPVVAWLQGVNPYDPAAYAATYPVTSTFALYAPHTLVLHLPFGLLPLEVAGWTYFLVALALMPVLAWVILRATGSDVTPARVFGIAALLVCSRPGQSTLFLGQYTGTVCLGVFLALAFARERPWLAGGGVAIAVVKPTFGLPLVGLMFARRDWRALVCGMGIAAILALVPTVTLTVPMAGASEWLAVLQRNRERDADRRFPPWSVSGSPVEDGRSAPRSMPS